MRRLLRAEVTKEQAPGERVARWSVSPWLLERAGEADGGVSLRTAVLTAEAAAAAAAAAARLFLPPRVERHLLARLHGRAGPTSALLDEVRSHFVSAGVDVSKSALFHSAKSHSVRERRGEGGDELTRSFVSPASLSLFNLDGDALLSLQLTLRRVRSEGKRARRERERRGVVPLVSPSLSLWLRRLPQNDDVITLATRMWERSFDQDERYVAAFPLTRPPPSPSPSLSLSPSPSPSTLAPSLSLSASSSLSPSLDAFTEKLSSNPAENVARALEEGRSEAALPLSLSARRALQIAQEREREREREREGEGEGERKREREGEGEREGESGRFGSVVDTAFLSHGDW